MSENTAFGVQERNKNQSYTGKKSNFLFLSCLNVEKINLFQFISGHHRKLTFFLVIMRQIHWV